MNLKIEYINTIKKLIKIYHKMLDENIPINEIEKLNNEFNITIKQQKIKKITKKKQPTKNGFIVYGFK